MEGLAIDDLEFGGPAYLQSRDLEKGDVIREVDGIAASIDEIQQALIGTDVPWSTVSLTVRKRSGKDIQAVLSRMPFSLVSNRLEMLDMLSSCKVMHPEEKSNRAHEM